MKLSLTIRKLGRLAFMLMWIPFSTMMFAMLGMPDGEYAWSELPLLARTSIVVGGTFAAAATILLISAPIASGLHNRTILNRGLPAEAIILKVMDTGTTINKNPLVRLLLEVHPPNQPTFQAEAERLISRLQIPQIQPGATVHVKYDPVSQAVALVEEDQD